MPRRQSAEVRELVKFAEDLGVAWRVVSDGNAIKFTPLRGRSFVIPAPRSADDLRHARARLERGA